MSDTISVESISLSGNVNGFIGYNVACTDAIVNMHASFNYSPKYQETCLESSRRQMR